ncbi:endonuclease/exonuclease/phosphatase family protein [Cohnella sp.]|uniref:endonuclease/exonuclease/phosphatase family protein n=1 Tax=Cohnella sp. TaxID=1883426 RepID=UPI0035640F1F
MDNLINLKVMSYNIRHGKGLDGKVSLRRIAEVITKTQSDVVALQGVDRFMPRSGFRDQLKKLAKQLGMHACFSPSINLIMIQYGNAILSHYPIISKDIQYIGGSKERRSVLIVKLQINECVVTIVNTHLGAHMSERIKQNSVLWSVLEKLEQPTILAGDFNMEMHDSFMKRLSSRWKKITPQNNLPTMENGTEIDHIFVNMSIEQATAKVIPYDASDHYPVIAEIRW